MLRRTGTCNRCGECCGWPRATDGGQNNPWPSIWPEAIQNWDTASINDDPLLRITGVPKPGSPRHGVVVIGGKAWSFNWLPNWGLASSKSQLWCPFLTAGPGPEHPCGVYDTDIFRNICIYTPPVEFDMDMLDMWHRNCPSCSYVYVEA